MTIPLGLCQCGCGQRTSPASQTIKRIGWVKGQPVRFVSGHNGRGQKRINPARGWKLPPRTPEHRAKLATMKGKRPSPVTRAKVHAFWDGLTLEQKLAMSAPGRDAARLHQHNGAHNSVWWAQRTPEQKAAIIAARNRSRATKWSLLTPEERRRRTEPQRMKATLASTRTRPTSIERAVGEVLTVLGVEFVTQAPIGRYVADFLIPSKRLIFECDGDYWHSLPHVKARDRARDEWLIAQGYTVVRLFEKAIRKGAALGAIRAVMAVA